MRDAISNTREKESLTDRKIFRQCLLVLLVKVRWKEVLEADCSERKWTAEKEAWGDEELEILFSEGYMKIKRVHVVSEYQLCFRTEETHGSR